jgi:hypothetical protein
MNAKDYSKDYWNSDHWKPQQHKSRSCSSQFLHLGVTAKWWWYSWQIIQLLPFSDFLILIRWWWWVHMFLSSWVVPLWNLVNYVRGCFSSTRNSIWVTDWLDWWLIFWAKEIMEVLTTRVCFSFVFNSCSTKGKALFRNHYNGRWWVNQWQFSYFSVMSVLTCSSIFLVCPELLDLQAGAFFLQFCDVASHGENHPPKGISQIWLQVREESRKI